MRSLFKSKRNWLLAITEGATTVVANVVTLGRLLTESADILLFNDGTWWSSCKSESRRGRLAYEVNVEQSECSP